MVQPASSQLPFLTATSSLSPSRKPDFHPNCFDLAANLPVAPEFEDGAALVGFQDDLRLALAQVLPRGVMPNSSALPYAEACWNNRRQRGFTQMVHLEA